VLLQDAGLRKLPIRFAEWDQCSLWCEVYWFDSTFLFALAFQRLDGDDFRPFYALVAYAFVVPALCELRKGRGTLSFVGASKIKCPGHPPVNVSNLAPPLVAPLT
jgi:hypothetical protein